MYVVQETDINSPLNVTVHIPLNKQNLIQL
jgi:hypothetical protein